MVPACGAVPDVGGGGRNTRPAVRSRPAMRSPAGAEAVAVPAGGTGPGGGGGGRTRPAVQEAGIAEAAVSSWWGAAGRAARGGRGGLPPWAEWGHQQGTATGWTELLDWCPYPPPRKRG